MAWKTDLSVNLKNRVDLEPCGLTGEVTKYRPAPSTVNSFKLRARLLHNLLGISIAGGSQDQLPLITASEFREHTTHPHPGQYWGPLDSSTVCLSLQILSTSKSSWVSPDTLKGLLLTFFFLILGYIPLNVYLNKNLPLVHSFEVWHKISYGWTSSVSVEKNILYLLIWINRKRVSPKMFICHV